MVLFWTAAASLGPAIGILRMMARPAFCKPVVSKGVNICKSAARTHITLYTNLSKSCVYLPYHKHALE